MANEIGDTMTIFDPDTFLPVSVVWDGLHWRRLPSPEVAQDMQTMHGIEMSPEEFNICYGYGVDHADDSDITFRYQGKEVKVSTLVERIDSLEKDLARSRQAIIELVQLLDKVIPGSSSSRVVSRMMDKTKDPPFSADRFTAAADEGPDD